MTDKKHKPFATYKQSADWITKNCDSCKKGFNKKRRRFRCDWEWALCVAAIKDGKVTEETAKAIGYIGNEGCIIWECPRWARR